MSGHLIEALSNDIAGGGLKLPGLGSFVLKERPERTGINPKTQKPYRSPARKVVQFKPSTQLVKKVNKVSELKK
jgi:DNA-binding protein HU-beta